MCTILSPGHAASAQVAVAKLRLMSKESQAPIRVHYGAGRSAVLQGVVPTNVSANVCTLQIGGIYAHHLGMQHAQLVKIELLSRVPIAESVLLVPASVDDWELIVSKHAVQEECDNIAGIECRSNRRTASTPGANS